MRVTVAFGRNWKPLSALDSRRPGAATVFARLFCNELIINPTIGDSKIAVVAANRKIEVSVNLFPKRSTNGLVGH